MREHTKAYLVKQIKQLQALVIKDGLTGLYNSRYIKEILHNEIYRAKRYDRPLSLLLIDVDDFKKINDKQGHLVGDKVLKRIADILKRKLRKSDKVGRYGGDEFLIILPETTKVQAGKIAKELMGYPRALSVRLSNQPPA